MVAQRQSQDEQADVEPDRASDGVRRERLRNMPGVVHRRRDPGWTGWSYEPWIRVREGYDVLKLIHDNEVLTNDIRPGAREGGGV